MNQLEKVRQWLEGGRQVGKRLTYQALETPYWLSIGVQKWQGSYKVQLVELPAQDLSYDTEPTRQEQLSFDSFEQLERYFDTVPAVSLAELAPLRGRKIFNPTFYIW